MLRATLGRANFWTYLFFSPSSLTGYHLVHLDFSLAVFYYMWIILRDHGRLRVPRQAKFLSCKYEIYEP